LGLNRKLLSRTVGAHKGFSLPSLDWPLLALMLRYLELAQVVDSSLFRRAGI